MDHRPRASRQSARSRVRPTTKPNAPNAMAIANPRATVGNVTSRTTSEGTNVAAAVAIAPSTEPNRTRSSSPSGTPDGYVTPNPAAAEAARKTAGASSDRTAEAPNDEIRQCRDAGKARPPDPRIAEVRHAGDERLPREVVNAEIGVFGVVENRPRE